MSLPNDPPRLSAGSPDFLREALAAAKVDQPSPERILLLQSKVSAMAAGGAATGGAGAGVAAQAKTAAWVKIAVAVGSASVLAVTGASMIGRSAPDRGPDPARASSSLAQPVVTPSASPSSIAIEDASVESPSAWPPAHAVPSAPPTSASQKPQSNDLSEETRLLGRAQQALHSNPSEALRVCERHRKEFPRGVLSQERDAVVVEALVLSGRKAEAKRAAAAFAQTYPGSSHLRRITDLVSD